MLFLVRLIKNPKSDNLISKKRVISENTTIKDKVEQNNDKIISNLGLTLRKNILSIVKF